MAVFGGLALGALLGALNGTIQVLTKVPAFIVTLGGLTAYKGLAEILASGRDLSRFPDAFQAIGSGYLMPMSIMFITALATGLFLTKTRLGSRAFAIGGNAEVARLAGVPIAKSRIYLLHDWRPFGGSGSRHGSFETQFRHAGAGPKLRALRHRGCRDRRNQPFSAAVVASARR